MIGSLGLYHDNAPRVIVRVIPWLSRDLRDRSLLARWDRLVRRWVRYRA